MLIIGIGIIIVLALIIHEKNKEIQKVKNENAMLHKNIMNMATILNKEEPAPKEEVVNAPQKKTPIVVRTREQTKKEREQNRNSLILITGSILIVLAAILFLTSTWNVLPNIIKVITVFLLIFVFLGMSYYADKKLLIPKTSKAFFYIAMIYIPISLLSIAPLGLLGENLKTGQGLYLYITISSIITSIIYYFASKKEEKLSYANYLFQILAIFSFFIYLKADYQIYLLGFTIYNIAILIKNIYFKTKISNRVETILNISLTTLLTLITSILVIANIISPINDINVVDLIPTYFITLLLQLIISIYYGRKENYHHATLALYTILFIASITVKLDVPILFQQIIMLITLIMLYIRLELDIKNTISLDWIILITTFMTLFIASMTTNYPWLATTLIFITILINICRYLKEKWEIHIALSIWLTAFFFYLLIYTLKLGYQEFIICLSITEIIRHFVMLKVKDIKLKETIELNTNIILIPCLIIYAIDNVLDKATINLLIPLIITITSILNYKTEKKSYHLLITYFAFSILLETIINIIPLDLPRYLSFTITSLILITIKLIDRKPLKEFKNYMSIYVFALLSVIFLDKNINLLLVVITILLTLLFNKKVEHNKILENTSYIFLSILLYTEEVIFYGIELNPILSLIIIIIWMKDAYLSKTRLTTDFLSLAYILLNHIMYPLNTYYTIVLLLVWSLANMDKKKKYKNSILICFYLTCLWLYNTLCSNIINAPTLITLFGYFITLFLITRTAIKDKEIGKTIEWLGTLLLFIISIFLYNNQLDGIIFVSFLILTTIIAYYKKIESLFYLSIIFILINVFLLTREFWFSLPWWLYILIIGIILIVFATNNELQQTIKKKKAIDRLNNHFKE